MAGFDFANILLSGPCNLRCRDCIGRLLPEHGRTSNLGDFPLKNLGRFADLLAEQGVWQLTLTGSNTDPQLYRHEPELLALLRRRVPGVRVSLHTNGLLALPKIDVLNLYDRATISLASFDAETCRRMTGRAFVLDLERILEAARVPIKISTLVTEDNIDEIPTIVARCRALGVRRMVLRKRYGERRDWQLLQDLSPVRCFAGNPVYDLDGIEVTLWDFHRTRLRCLNLFSDGHIGDDYELAES